LKIGLSQINVTIGDIQGNTQKIIDNIRKAKNQNLDLICFPELTICGYIPHDLLEYDHFIDACEDALNQIRFESDDMGIIVGAPCRSHLPDGKKLYNSAYLFHNQKLVKRIDKTLLPTYDIFDEYRYFEPNRIFETVPFKDENIAITICEDLWNLGEDKLYPITPMDELMKHQPTLMINLSASPYNYTKSEIRRERMEENAKHYQLPLVYANQVGANTEVLFDGKSLIIDKTGKILFQLPAFEEGFQVFDTNENYNPKHIPPCETIPDIHDALIMGIRDYFSKLNIKNAVLGVSGGIDSAVVMALACEALGSENVTGLLMPSPYSSEGSVTDSELLANNLVAKYHIVPISSIYQNFKDTLSPIFNGRKEDVTEENIQARCRGVLLMAYSNKMGGIVLNTSNKSESAVGYTTLYGDMCGGLSVIGDLYKEQVYAIARYINEKHHREVIPNSIITKPPSAELRPGQKDEDSLPPYPVLDQILFQYIEQKNSIDGIIALGFEPETVKRIISLVNRNEYKRFQAAPNLRISEKAFGFGRRIPIVGKF
jgi:NAD+ synthase (glutamine-hydrolysing)